MNDLTIRKVDLPSLPMEDTKRYIDVIGDAITVLKGKKDAAVSLGADQTLIDRMDNQIREYSAIKLRAQMELGKKTAKMETVHRNQNTALSADGAEGKFEKLQKMGFPVRRVSEYERMARNEDAVNNYIESQLAAGKAPSQNGALKAATGNVPKTETHERKEGDSKKVEYTPELLKEEFEAVVEDFVNKCNRMIDYHRDIVTDNCEVFRKVFEAAKNEINYFLEVVK